MERRLRCLCFSQYLGVVAVAFIQDFEHYVHLVDLSVITELPPDAAEDLRERSLTQTLSLNTHEGQENSTLL